MKGRACSSTAYDDVLNRINFEGDDTVRPACRKWPSVRPLSHRLGIHMHVLLVSLVTKHARLDLSCCLCRRCWRLMSQRRRTEAAPTFALRLVKDGALLSNICLCGFCCLIGCSTQSYVSVLCLHCQTTVKPCRLASAFSFHTSPPSKNSFFQMGTFAFSASMSQWHACASAAPSVVRACSWAASAADCFTIHSRDAVPPGLRDGVLRKQQ